MISIIIIVNKDKKIKLLLNKLTEFPKPEKTEIIVVDKSQGYLNKIKNQFHQVNWIEFKPIIQKKYSYSDQRNLGIKNAKGDIIVFIDSDCIPTENWLSELVKPIKNNNENIVAGFVKATGNKSINNIIWEKAENKEYLSECPSLNMAFKSDILKQVGYFNDEFNSGGEDIDFCWRAINSGYKIYYNKNAIIFHDWGNLQKEIERALRGGKTSVLLYKNHPEKWMNLITNNADALIYPIYIIFSPLIFYYPYYILLLIIPFIRNLKTRSLRNLALVKIILDLIRGYGVLYGLIQLNF